MKTLQVVFTDAEFKKLKKAKKLSSCINWNTFIINTCSKGVSVRHNKNGNKL